MSAQKLGAATAAEAFRHRYITPMQRVQRALHRYPQISPCMVLLATLVTFAFASPRFLQPSNLSLILQQVAIVGSLGIGQTLVILTAGIDLSVGAIMILVAMVVGQLAGYAGLPGWLSLLLGLGVGTGAGFANGLLVAYIGLPPFIVTLGTLNVFTAIALIMSGGRSIPGAKLGSFLTWTNVSLQIGTFRMRQGSCLWSSCM